MFYRLRPAGNPVSFALAGDPHARLAALFAPYRPFYFHSGAAALAAAIQAVLAGCRDGRRRVVLPAYGCPELVSAVLHAGGQPVLVDLEADRPWLNLAALQSTLDEQVAAVVAVSLFGIPERTSELREAAQRVGAVLICDHAQWFPGPQGWAQQEADLAVVSFGRGKPVSVLGGGAVLARGTQLAQRLEGVAAAAQAAEEPGFSLAVKIAIYNALISPYLYWLPDSLPLLGLGETRFKPLPAVRQMDAARRRRLPANIERYWRCATDAPTWLAALVQRHRDAGVMDLAIACGGQAGPRLLRFPLLCASRELRDALYDGLRAWGASRLYRSPLPQVSGLEGMFDDQGPFPHATAFANRLLTLPTHEGVKRHDVARMEHVLTTVLGAQRASGQGVSP